MVKIWFLNDKRAAKWGISSPFNINDSFLIVFFFFLNLWFLTNQEINRNQYSQNRKNTLQSFQCFKLRHTKYQNNIEVKLYESKKCLYLSFIYICLPFSYDLAEEGDCASRAAQKKTSFYYWCKIILVTAQRLKEERLESKSITLHCFIEESQK